MMIRAQWTNELKALCARETRAASALFARLDGLRYRTSRHAIIVRLFAALRGSIPTYDPGTNASIAYEMGALAIAGLGAGFVAGDVKDDCVRCWSHGGRRYTRLLRT